METQNYYKGYNILIEQDENNFGDTPDDWGNDARFLVYDHRQFNVTRSGFNPDNIFETMQTGKKLFAGYFYFPVYAYIHSGVALSLGPRDFLCPGEHLNWGVSFKGFALIKKEKGSYTRQKAYDAAKELLNTWNDYLSGNIWGYMIKDKSDETIESCFGFYGNPETSGCFDEAKDTIDFLVKATLKTRFEKVKIWIKNNVPFEIRQKEILLLV